MKKNILFFTVFIFFVLFSYGQEKYIKKYSRISDSLALVYGIPRAVILSVAIVESSAGMDKKANILKNHFGITGKNKIAETHKIKTRYKQYKSVEDSYVAFCELIVNKKFYKKLRGSKNYELWIHEISRTGYSEKPDVWKNRVVGVIKKYKL